MSTRPLDPHWRLAWLYAAPHRLALAAGALMLAPSAAWWVVAVLAQSGGHALHFGLPPIVAHGLLMVLGFMPLFGSARRGRTAGLVEPACSVRLGRNR
jgi:uncharacterized protein involved in response to NO